MIYEALSPYEFYPFQQNLLKKLKIQSLHPLLTIKLNNLFDMSTSSQYHDDDGFYLMTMAEIESIYIRPFSLFPFFSHRSNPFNKRF